MGLKSGSRDTEIDQSENRGNQTETEESGKSGKEESGPEDGPNSPKSGRNTENESRIENLEETNRELQRPSITELPYKLQRDAVNEGRKQVPYFLRHEIIEAEETLKNTLEDILGEEVYKSDYREAAMVVAQRNPERVAAVLREWGYDLGSDPG